jgi:uncharacterized protein (DUF427 family)
MALQVASHLFSALDQLRFQPTSKRVRAYVDGRPLIDSTDALIVWEPRRVVPSYAVPISALAAELTPAAPVDADEHAVRLGDGPSLLDPRTAFAFHTTAGASFDVVAGRTLPAAAFVPEDRDFDGYVIVDFDAFDEWREEDEVIIAHPRDPFSRVECRRSSRHVVVELDGVKLADTTSPVLLFETFLPARIYLPRDDARMELLSPTDTTTVCAYKGRARYWSATISGATVPDLVWSYEDPLHEALPVKDMLCFFNERVDMTVDGVRLDRPITPWS